jgi:hypothetical protein
MVARIIGGRWRPQERAGATRPADFPRSSDHGRSRPAAAGGRQLEDERHHGVARRGRAVDGDAVGGAGALRRHDLSARHADCADGPAGRVEPHQVGGQDCHSEAKGAHTGDISAEMLSDAGCSGVIVGHSERRADHGETDTLIRDKAAAAHRAGLTAIICIGETLEEREAGRTLDVVGPAGGRAAAIGRATTRCWPTSRCGPSAPG